MAETRTYTPEEAHAETNTTPTSPEAQPSSETEQLEVDGGGLHLERDEQYEETKKGVLAEAEAILGSSTETPNTDTLEYLAEQQDTPDNTAEVQAEPEADAETIPSTDEAEPVNETRAETDVENTQEQGPTAEQLQQRRRDALTALDNMPGVTGESKQRTAEAIANGSLTYARAEGLSGMYATRAETLTQEKSDAESRYLQQVRQVEDQYPMPSAEEQEANPLAAADVHEDREAALNTLNQDFHSQQESYDQQIALMQRMQSEIYSLAGETEGTLPLEAQADVSSEASEEETEQGGEQNGDESGSENKRSKYDMPTMTVTPESQREVQAAAEAQGNTPSAAENYAQTGEAEPIANAIQERFENMTVEQLQQELEQVDAFIGTLGERIGSIEEGIGKLHDEISSLETTRDLLEQQENSDTSQIEALIEAKQQELASQETLKETYARGLELVNAYRDNVAEVLTAKQGQEVREGEAQEQAEHWRTELLGLFEELADQQLQERMDQRLQEKDPPQSFIDWLMWLLFEGFGQG